MQLGPDVASFLESFDTDYVRYQVGVWGRARIVIANQVGLVGRHGPRHQVGLMGWVGLAWWRWQAWEALLARPACKTVGGRPPPPPTHTHSMQV